MAKRKFTNEYKAEAVRLVLEQGLSVHQVAEDLGIKDTTLHGWLKKAREGVLDPQSPKSQELEELKRLRRENAVVLLGCPWLPLVWHYFHIMDVWR